MGTGNCLERGTSELSGIMEMFYIVIGVLVTRMYIFATVYQIIHLLLHSKANHKQNK